MVRVALLVTVLAALCYTSQAIPVQIGNTEFELRKEISDQIQQILDHIPEEVNVKIEDVRNKIMGHVEQLEKEFQEKKKIAVNIFEKAKEKAKKLLQEGNKNVNEVLEKLKKVKQEIETNYQHALNDKIQNIKDLLGKLTNEELKLKLKEKLDSLQDKVKETLGEVLRKKQSGGESYGIGNILEKGKGIVNGVQDKLTESSKNIMNNADEVVKKFKENINEILEKDGKIKDLKNILDKSWDTLKEAIKNIKGEAKNEASKAKRSVSKVMRDQQVQQASVTSDFFDMNKSWVEDIKNGLGNIGRSGINNTKAILDNIGNILDAGLGPDNTTKEDVKEDTKEDSKST